MDAGPVAQVLGPEFRSVAQGDPGGFAAPAGAERERAFLSTLSPGKTQRRLALAVVLLSAAAFAAAAPFARTPLAKVDAFIPAYQAALALSDLITAVLLYGQFSILRLPQLRVVASGYLFTALMVVVHTL